MATFHPKVFEYLIKSYFYVGDYSYEYLLDTINVLPLSKKFSLEELKINEREKIKREISGTMCSLEEMESIVWGLRDKAACRVYKELLEYFKSLTQEDICSLLLVLLPDTKFEKMLRNKWNHYGEFVSDWHKNLIHYMAVCGIQYDPNAKQLVSPQEEIDIKRIIASSNLIGIQFDDLFYRKLSDEINLSLAKRYEKLLKSKRP